MAVKLVLFGRQGAGKGTQSALLSKHYGAPHISTGDMLREAVAEGTDFGLQAKTYIESGALLPDEIMLGVISERFGHDDVQADGFLLDGFPRTVGQAEALLEHHPIDLAVNLEVPRDVVLERLSSRRVCSNCGAIYSTAEPPDHPVGLRRVRRRGRAARRRHPGGHHRAPRGLRARHRAGHRRVRPARACWSASTAWAVPRRSRPGSSPPSTPPFLRR